MGNIIEESVKKAYIFILTIFCILSAKAADNPNIVVILNDDMGYQDLGCFGSPTIKTPCIDKMAAEGMKMTDFYMASSVCSPSRAALLTGQYPNKVKVNRVIFAHKKAKGLDPKHLTIAKLLKTVGYKTKAVGKWHLGHREMYLPNNNGFDTFYGIPYSNDMKLTEGFRFAESCLYREGIDSEKIKNAFRECNSNNTFKGGEVLMNNKVPLMCNDEIIEFPADQTTITHRFASEGMKFITESVNEKKPFFLYLANSMPHTPLYTSPQFENKSKHGLYGDVIEEIDYNVGRIMDHIKKLGIEENTIVIFTSDNGPWLVKGKKAGSALPLFEGKFSHFEGGYRVPTIVRWPGKVPAGSVCSELATAMDLLPLCARIAGVQLGPQTPIDGKDIFPLITGVQGAKTPYEYFFYGKRAVRSGDWKYHKEELFVAKTTRTKTPGPSLYNLKDDIGESKNIINEYPEIAARLADALTKHK